MNTTAMTYSTAQINRDFRIKVYSYNNSDERLNLLVGVSGQKQFLLKGRENRMQAASRLESNILFKITCKIPTI